MGIEKNPLGKPCVGCFFLGRNLGNCDYWLIMDKLRPCPGGKDCTVKTKTAPPGYEDRMKWDTAFAKRMYDRGATDEEIAKAVGAGIAELKSYRKRKWGKANCKAGKSSRAKWDTRKGFELYKQGLPDAEIARELGITTKTLSNYRAYHWGARNASKNKGGRPYGGTGWDKGKGFALYMQGVKDAEIARQLGATEAAVANYRRRHWGQRQGANVAAWDTEAGKRMRLEGASFSRIAKELGTTKECVAQYARRHWRGEE